MYVSGIVRHPQRETPRCSGVLSRSYTPTCRFPSPTHWSLIGTGRVWESEEWRFRPLPVPTVYRVIVTLGLCEGRTVTVSDDGVRGVQRDPSGWRRRSGTWRSTTSFIGDRFKYGPYLPGRDRRGCQCQQVKRSSWGPDSVHPVDETFSWVLSLHSQFLTKTVNSIETEHQGL